MNAFKSFLASPFSQSKVFFSCRHKQTGSVAVCGRQVGRREKAKGERAIFWQVISHGTACFAGCIRYYRRRTITPPLLVLSVLFLN